jgi:hypothetical protein
VRQLFIDLEKAYDSVRKELLCNILTESGVPMKQVRLIKMWLIETCSKAGIGKYLLDKFPTQNALREGNAS